MAEREPVEKLSLGEKFAKLGKLLDLGGAGFAVVITAAGATAAGVTLFLASAAGWKIDDVTEKFFRKRRLGQ